MSDSNNNSISKRVSWWSRSRNNEEISRARRSSTLGSELSDNNKSPKRLKVGVIRTTLENQKYNARYTLVPSGYLTSFNTKPMKVLVKNIFDSMGLAPDVLFECPGNWTYTQMLSDKVELPKISEVARAFEVCGTSAMVDDLKFKDQDGNNTSSGGSSSMLRHGRHENGAVIEQYNRFLHLFEIWENDSYHFPGYLAIHEEDIISLCEYTNQYLLSKTKTLQVKEWKEPFLRHLINEEVRLKGYLFDLQETLRQQQQQQKQYSSPKPVGKVGVSKKSKVSRVVEEESRRWSKRMSLVASEDDFMTCSLIFENEKAQLKFYRQHVNHPKTFKEYIETGLDLLDQMTYLLSKRPSSLPKTEDIHAALELKAKLKAFLHLKPLKDGKKIGLIEIFDEFVGREKFARDMFTGDDEKAGFDESALALFAKYQRMSRLMDQFKVRRFMVRQKSSRLETIMRGLSTALSGAGSLIMIDSPFILGGASKLIAKSVDPNSELLSVALLDDFLGEDDLNIQKRLKQAPEFDPQSYMGSTGRRPYTVSMDEGKMERRLGDRAKKVNTKLNWLLPLLGDVTLEDGSLDISPSLLEKIETASLGDYGSNFVQSCMLMKGVSHVIIFESVHDRNEFRDAVRDVMINGMLMVGGKTYAWEEAVRALKVNSPLFVFDGSGGSADIFAQVAKHKGLRESDKELRKRLQRVQMTFDTATYESRKQDAAVLAKDWPDSHSCIVINIEDTVDRLQEKITRVMAERYLPIKPNELGALAYNRRRLQNAWGHYALFLSNEKYYSIISRILRNLIAIQGLIATISAVMLGSTKYCPGNSYCDAAKYLASIMPILAAILFGVEETIEAGATAKQLLLARRLIEKEINLFRAGAGPYATGLNIAQEEEENAEIPRTKFATRIEEIYTNVSNLPLRRQPYSISELLEKKQGKSIDALKVSIQQAQNTKAISKRLSAQWGNKVSTTKRNNHRGNDISLRIDSISSDLGEHRRPDIQQQVKNFILETKRKVARHFRKHHRDHHHGGREDDDDDYDDENDNKDLELGSRRCESMTSCDSDSSDAYFEWSNNINEKKRMECNPLHYHLSAEIYRRTRFEILQFKLQYTVRNLLFWNIVYQILIIASSTVSAFFVVLGIEEWVPLLLAFSAIMTGWREMEQISMRLKISSKALSNMKQLGSWWDGLNAFESRMPSNMRHLVERSEEIYLSQVLVFSASNLNQSEAPEADIKQTSKNGDHNTVSTPNDDK